MRAVEVNLRFRGTATILVPNDVSEPNAKVLARKLAVAQILATFENEDCGECLLDACDEFLDECFEDDDVSRTIGEAQFDSAKAAHVDGTWTLDD